MIKRISVCFFTHPSDVKPSHVGLVVLGLRAEMDAVGVAPHGLLADGQGGLVGRPHVDVRGDVDEVGCRLFSKNGIEIWFGVCTAVCTVTYIYQQGGGGMGGGKRSRGRRQQLGRRNVKMFAQQELRSRWGKG